jgi:exonuclease VII large subunit
MLGAYGVEATLGRGFALVVDERGTVVRSVKSIAAGDRLSVRLDDGAAVVTVEEINA